MGPSVPIRWIVIAGAASRAFTTNAGEPTLGRVVDVFVAQHRPAELAVVGAS